MGNLSFKELFDYPDLLLDEFSYAEKKMDYRTATTIYNCLRHFYEVVLSRQRYRTQRSHCLDVLIKMEPVRTKSYLEAKKAYSKSARKIKDDENYINGTTQR